MKVITVKVKPNARKSSIAQGEQGNYIAHVKSPPVDGKANTELIRIVAEHFGCPRSCVKLKTGKTSRLKTVEIFK